VKRARTPHEIAAKWADAGATPARVQAVKLAMWMTWEGIASDWLSGFDGGEEEAYQTYPSEEDMIVEATIDAKRIVSMSGLPRQDLDWIYMVAGGWDTLSELAKDCLATREP
jgi:hypothetical protein